jgi:hypothetical protein
MGYNELDELLKLTTMVEATSTNQGTEEPEEDIPATVRVYDENDYSGKAKVLNTKTAATGETEQPTVLEVPQKPKGDKAYGSSGNQTFTDEHGNPIENGPLFEEDGPTTNVDSSTNDSQTQTPDVPVANPEQLQQSNDNIGEAAQEIQKAGETIQNIKGSDNAPAGTPDGAPADTESSLGKSFARSFSFGLGESVVRGMGRDFARRYMLECAAPSAYTANNPFKLGDAVQVNGVPRIFVVKNTDGNMITTARPTNCAEDFAQGKDGVWPEFCFQSNDLSKIDSADITQGDDIAEFNDKMTVPETIGFDGLDIDPKPMDIAQNYAKKFSMDEVGENLDNILGAYNKASHGDNSEFIMTRSTPLTTYVLPNGQLTTQSFEGEFIPR